MAYYNNATITGANDIAFKIVFGEGMHAHCREQVFLNLCEFEHLLHSKKEHLCAYLHSLIYFNFCGCEVCKKTYEKYAHFKKEYEMEATNDRG